MGKLILRIALNVDPRAQTREVILKADKPLVSSSAGELVFSTVLTLLAIPLLYRLVRTPRQQPGKLKFPGRRKQVSP